MAYERCVIFGAGEYYEGPAPAIEKGMLAIAADGGLDHMRAMGLSPDFVIGDFDSLSGDVPDGDRSVRLPPQKDDPLFSVPNLIVTPHLGGDTYEAKQRISSRTAETLIRALNGEATYNWVNRTAMESIGTAW